MRNTTVSRILRQVRFCCHIMFLHLWWWATVRLSPINKDSWNLMFYDPSCCSKRILILKHDLPNNSAVYDWWPQLHVKQQARAPCSLISLSCHSACCERSITEQWYHAIDSVSTIVGETASGAWSMVPPIHHSTIGWGYRAKPFPNGPNYPLYPLLSTGYALEEWNMPALSTSEKKKKSISFIHLWIDWYNGIADFDLPSLWHSQYLYNYISCFTTRILGTVSQGFHFQQMVPDPKLYVYAVLYDSDVMSVTNVFGQCLIMHGSVQSAEFQVCFLTIVLWLVYLFWGDSSYWCGEPRRPHGRLSVLCPCDTVFSPTSLLLWCSVLLLLLPNARRAQWPLMTIGIVKPQSSRFHFPSNVWLRMIAGTNLLQPLL